MAELVDWTFHEHLADGRWSTSSLSTLLDDGLRAAWEAHNGRGQLSTRAQTKGNVGHTAIWEGPEVFKARYVVANRNTKGGKARAAEAAANGLRVITESVYAESMAMAESVAKMAAERADDGDDFLANLLAADGLREQSFVWDDEETAIGLKGRADKLLTEVPVIADLKFSRSWRPTPDEWIKEAVRYGVHRQAANYSEAYRQIFGRTPAFYFIVVHSAPPYEVGVYKLGDEELELGRRQMRRALWTVMRCTETGRWFEPYERNVHAVQYPAWVHEEEDRLQSEFEQDQRMEWANG